MTDAEIDELGPVDYLVVEFPAETSHFTGEMAQQLLELVDRKTIRLFDLLILRKDENNVVEAFEIEDLEGANEVQVLETEIAEILAEEDVIHLAAAMETSSTAGVLVWENTWPPRSARPCVARAVS